MNVYNKKYEKYKKKYLQLQESIENNLKGGVLLGKGGYGSVFTPRLPFILYNGILDNYNDRFISECIKLFERNKLRQYYDEIEGYQNFINFLTGNSNFYLDNPILQEHYFCNYFIFPIKYGEIDYRLLKTAEFSINNYNTKWIEKEIPVIKFYEDENVEKESFETKLRTSYCNKQISFFNGEEVIHDLSIIKLFNILTAIKNLQERDFIFGDLSDNNIIEHNKKYKIIDFSCIGNIKNIIRNYNTYGILRTINYNIHPRMIKIILNQIIYPAEPIILSHDDRFIKTSREIYDMIKISSNYLIHGDIIIHFEEFNITIKELIENIFIAQTCTSIDNISIICETLKSYYSNRYGSKYVEILLKKIDMFSIGFILLRFFIETPITEPEIITKLFKLISYFTLYYYKDITGTIIPFDRDIDFIIHEYINFNEKLELKKLNDRTPVASNISFLDLTSSMHVDEKKGNKNYNISPPSLKLGNSENTIIKQSYGSMFNKEA
jgi:hypothetical protein